MSIIKDFFILEGAYIIISLFVLLITFYVTTRPFMSKNAKKRGLISVFLISFLFITGHFLVTKNRINNVKKAFISGKSILCENRLYTKAAQFITVNKNFEWDINNNYFISPNYERKFHLSRCIVK